MGTRTRSKYYYWLPVFALFGLFCLLGIIILVSLPKITQALSDSPVADIGWSSQLERSLESVGIEVHGLKIVGGPDQPRQLQISISNIVNREESEPITLVSSIHLFIGAGLYFSETPPERIDSILVNVLDENQERMYSVTIQASDLEALVLKQISEQEFLNRWIISE